MYLQLKESKPHGTKAYPYTQYHVQKNRSALHIPVHWHEEIEIIYIKKGKLRISIEGELYEGAPGEIYLVNPGELHYMETSSIPADYYTILFPLEFVSFRTSDDVETDFMNPFREKRMLLIHDVNEKHSVGKMEQTLWDLIEMNESKNGMYQLRTKAQLIELLAKFAEEDCFYESKIRKNSNLQRDMISYIQDRFTDKLTLGMLAEEFHMSEKYISRYFKEKFSIGFMQYIGHLRMERAKILLQDSDLSVMDVALASGYPSVNFFIRNFKEQYNMTPLQYRKTKEK